MFSARPFTTSVLAAAMLSLGGCEMVELAEEPEEFVTSDSAALSQGEKGTPINIDLDPPEEQGSDASSGATDEDAQRKSKYLPWEGLEDEVVTLVDEVIEYLLPQEAPPPDEVFDQQVVINRWLSLVRSDVQRDLLAELVEWSDGLTEERRAALPRSPAAQLSEYLRTEECWKRFDRLLGFAQGVLDPSTGPRSRLAYATYYLFVRYNQWHRVTLERRRASGRPASEGEMSEANIIRLERRWRQFEATAFYRLGIRHPHSHQFGALDHEDDGLHAGP